MPEHLALNESEQPLPIVVKPVRVHVARHVSNVLSPAAVSLPSVALVALYHTRNSLAALAYACVTLFFLSFGPMAYIIIGVRRGKFIDADVSIRSQRIGPFLFGLGSTLLGLGVLSFFHGPKNLETLLLNTLIIGLIMMVITLWWKISLHASSLAGALTMLTALYGNAILPAFALVVLVSWSRVVLRRHTVAQVVAGSVVSIVLAAVLLRIRGV